MPALNPLLDTATSVEEPATQRSKGRANTDSSTSERWPGPLLWGGGRKAFPNKEVQAARLTPHPPATPPPAIKGLQEISEPRKKISFLTEAEMKATTFRDKDLWTKAVACRRASV